jgi:ribosomal protein S21
MITVVEVKKNTNESGMNLVRRFQRKVQESGIVQKVKSKRYNERSQSKLSTKNAALKRMKNKKEYERLFKLGKVVKKVRGRR